jgi:hypothetical protein
MNAKLLAAHARGQSSFASYLLIKICRGVTRTFSNHVAAAVLQESTTFSGESAMGKLANASLLAGVVLTAAGCNPGATEFGRKTFAMMSNIANAITVVETVGKVYSWAHGDREPVKQRAAPNAPHPAAPTTGQGGAPLRCPAAFGRVLPGPRYDFPCDGQELDAEGDYLFQVGEVPGASGYLWGFFQGGKCVWENNSHERTLSGRSYGLIASSRGWSTLHAGDVEVWCRAYVDNRWTEATTIKVKLRPRLGPNPELGRQ